MRERQQNWQQSDGYRRCPRKGEHNRLRQGLDWRQTEAVDMILAVLKIRAIFRIRRSDSLDLMMAVSRVKGRRVAGRLFRAQVLVGGGGEVETADLQSEKEEHDRGQQSPGWRATLRIGAERKAVPLVCSAPHSVF